MRLPPAPAMRPLPAGAMGRPRAPPRGNGARNLGRRAAVAAIAALVVLAGCAEPAAKPATSSTSAASVAPPREHEVVCRVVDGAGTALPQAACAFEFGGPAEALRTDANGTASRKVREGATGTLAASAPDHLPNSVRVTVQGPLAVRIALARQPEAAAAGNATAGPEPEPPVEVVARRWEAPVRVVEGSGQEPHVAVAADGTVYYSPLSTLYRSDDGGRTFADVGPAVPDTLPTLVSDTSVHIAPDGSVWWSRTWGYASGTIGCTSTDRAQSWTCDSLAVPGVTDRMWIAGKSATVGYVQTNQGLYHHQWAATTTGSLAYTPHAVSTSLLNVRNGNIVYDEAADAFWQIEFDSGGQRLMRIDGALGLISSTPTGVPATYALPWLSVQDGTLWTTGEPEGGDRTRSVLAARSTDQGASWQQFPIASQAQSVTFSYVAAGPGGRVVVVYYGSDKPGPSTENGGVWSLYVAETDNGLDPEPVWVETKVVDAIHEGNLCIGLNCEQTGGDPEARFAGDLIGAWVDSNGDAHLAYAAQGDDGPAGMYVRQRLTAA